MPYIGNQPGTGVRSRFIYTATASQTTFSGADDNSKTLKYADSDYIDVYLNGVCLVPGTDYTASTKTSVVLTQAASLNDTLEVVAYDIASMADTVSKADGGTFDGNVTFGSGADIITETLGTDNVRLGEGAGDSIASGGNDNVTIGKNAGTALSTGDSNVAIGHEALAKQTTVSNNTAVGNLAGEDNTSGVGLSAFGHGALQNNTSGNYNTAIGESALSSDLTGGNNTAVGYNAGLFQNGANFTTAIGAFALDAVTSGSGNTAVGEGAGGTITTGESNTFIGRSAGADSGLATRSNNTIIGRFNGHSSHLDITSVDRNVVISDGSAYPVFNTRQHQEGATTIDVSGGENNATYNVVGIANGATVSLFSDANAFSGMFVFNEIAITGATGLILSGGGALTIVNQNGGSTLVASSSPTSGKIGIFLDSLKVKVKNNQGSTCFFRVISLRTRLAQ